MALTLLVSAVPVASMDAVTAPKPGWLHDLWSAQGFLEGVVDDSSHVRGQWPANVSFGQIIDTFVPLHTRNKFLINLGANDGARHDPSFPLFVERGYGGILVEGDPAFKKRLYANMKPFNATGNVHISWGFASASAIGPRLLAQGSPRDPDALKIDVDGLDAALLEGILLAGITPKAIVVEVNPDIPPPLRMSQLYHDAFKFEFERKHMRGWLGASADTLYTMLDDAGYALVAIELGTREHMVCNKQGRRQMCKKKGTCTHCENNMWFVTKELLRSASGVEPPTWPQFVNGFWKQTFAFNTFSTNRASVFQSQTVQHTGWFPRTDEEKPFKPSCYSLSDKQYYQAQPGESFTKPECPLVTLRAEVSPEVVATAETGSQGWRAWAKFSQWLARPANAAKAAAYAKSTAEAIKAPACRPDETCPYNATASTHASRGRLNKQSGGAAARSRELRGGRQLSEGLALQGKGRGTKRLLSAADYTSWIKTPEQVKASRHAFVMNAMTPGHGHVLMARNFTALLGLKNFETTGLNAVRKLQASGAPFAYMTLTNDHQPLTEHGHDRTLTWERSQASRSANGVFIGPPSKHILEGPRKAMFCDLSENLVRRTGDPWQRFAPPCVTKSRDGKRNGEEYGALLHAAPPLVKDAAYAKHSAPPRWLTRKVATKKVAAAGSFMYPLSHDRALQANLTMMHKFGPLLLRYLDPPLLQKGVHLGTPVNTRVETRIFGLVQWEPLRIWTSRYGFFRGGTPWFNYSAGTDTEFTAANGAMWNVNRGVEARCEAVPPRVAPPWIAPEAYAECVRKRARSARSPSSECCVCMTVADVFDVEHDERGFATSGTLRRLDHVAEAAGLDPKRVWQNVDEALIREMIAEQRYYQSEAAGAPLSRWATVFSADVGFAADGRAYLYENLLMPNWKRPGYFWHEAVDRAGAVGIYSGQMLAMANLLMDDAVDEFHSRVLKPLSLEAQAEQEARTFLRTQGFASTLGYRRTWPTPPRTADRSFDKVADARDVAFAKLLNENKLLLQGMDVLSPDGSVKADVFGGPTANLLERTTPRWPVGKGVLWNSPTGVGRGAACRDTPAILAAYKAQAEGRRSS